MRKNVYTWYKSQVGIKKWLLIFVLNWLYWDLINGITTLIFKNEQDNPVRYFLFSTTIMALLWTFFFDAWLSPIIKKRYGVSRQSDTNKNSP